MSTLITEALRQRKALEYYANPDSYLDGVPSHVDDDGMLVIHDEGMIAQVALRRVDHHNGPGVLVEASHGENASQ